MPWKLRRTEREGVVRYYAKKPLRLSVLLAAAPRPQTGDDIRLLKARSDAVLKLARLNGR